VTIVTGAMISRVGASTADERNAAPTENVAADASAACISFAACAR
jgi:hypothetical protein